MNLLKRYFHANVIAVTIVLTSLFAMFLPNVIVNAASAQIEIISIEETSSSSIKILFNSKITKKQISNFTITAVPKLSDIAQSGNLQQIKPVSKLLIKKASGLIEYELKPINLSVPHIFKICAKGLKAKTFCSDPWEYTSLTYLSTLISNLPSDWANPRPTTTPVPAPAFTLSSASQSVTVNSAITTVTSTSTGGAITSYSISPAAPAGLTFSNSTGQLSGTPTAIQSSTTYTITATNASGSATATFTLTVSPGAAVKVAVTRASVGTSPGFAFTTQPQVTIQDSSGNTITSSSAVVTATVSAGGALVGTATATASSGVATFSDLGIRGFGGAAYTITYTAPGLTANTQIVTPSALARGASGPGGGLIYYVAPTSAGFTCGPTRNETCYYLEAAPSNWSGVSDPTKVWAVAGVNTDVTGVTEYADNATALFVSSGIGLGYQDSRAIVTYGNNTTSAAGAARAYTGGSKNDWYLGSPAELNLLCQWARGVDSNVGTLCTGGSLNSPTYGASAAGLTGGRYWSSSQALGYNSYAYTVDFSGSYLSRLRDATESVRPIRAF